MVGGRKLGGKQAPSSGRGGRNISKGQRAQHQGWWYGHVAMHQSCNVHATTRHPAVPQVVTDKTHRQTFATQI